MWWPRQGTYEKRPTAERVRLLLPLAALGALLAFGEPGVLLTALLPQGATESLPEYGRALPAYSPFSKTLLTSLAPFLAAALVLALVAARYAVKAKAAAAAINARPLDDLLRGERGVSALEFMLLLPLLLVIMLSILQIALIVQAKFVVNYAAFCAVRSAIVTIPGKVQGEGPQEARNEIRPNDADSPKMKMIRNAAKIPCAAVSPRVTPENTIQMTMLTGGALSLSGISMLDDFAKVALFTPAQTPGPQVLEQFFLRVPYSFHDSNTSVAVTGGSLNGQTMTFGEAAPITVTVTHRYFLAVPFASRFFGTKYFNDGWIPGGAIRSGFYLNITEQYSLLNEGERTNRPEDTIE